GPGVAVGAVVLPHRAPLPFAQVRTPEIPVAGLAQPILQPPERFDPRPPAVRPGTAPRDPSRRPGAAHPPAARSLRPAPARRSSWPLRSSQATATIALPPRPGRAPELRTQRQVIPH